MTKPCVAFSVFLVFPSSSIQSQDIRASSYELFDIGGQQFLNRLQLYVDAELDVHRDSVLVFWGVAYSWLPLTESELLNEGEVTKHTFVRSFPYPGPGVYQLDILIGARVAGIANLVNSVETESRLQPWFILTPQLENSSPVVADLSAPITQTTHGAQFALMIEDADGDSLVFSLVPCNGEGYFIPDGTTIDPQTGELTCEPPEPGLYAFCTRIDELRDGQVIASTYTDMVMQVDHVAGVEPKDVSDRCGLFPQAIAYGSSSMVRCKGLSQLVLFDITGRVVYEQLVTNGITIDTDVIVTGTHIYCLTNTQDGSRVSGKLVVY